MGKDQGQEPWEEEKSQRRGKEESLHIGKEPPETEVRLKTQKAPVAYNQESRDFTGTMGQS